MQGGGLGDEGRSERRAEPVGPDDRHAAVALQVDRDGATVGVQPERQVEGARVVAAARPQVVTRGNAQRGGCRRALHGDAARRAALEGDGPRRIGCGRQVRCGDLVRVVVLDREGSPADAQESGRPRQLAVEQLVVEGRGECTVRSTGPRVGGHRHVETVTDDDLESGGVDRCLRHLLGVQPSPRADPVAAGQERTDGAGAPTGQLAQPDPVDLVASVGERLVGRHRRHGRGGPVPRVGVENGSDAQREIAQLLRRRRRAPVDVHDRRGGLARDGAHEIGQGRVRRSRHHPDIGITVRRAYDEVHPGGH